VSEAFSGFLAESQRSVQLALSNLLGEAASEFVSGEAGLEGFFVACRYPLDSGGKHIRATMVFAAAKIAEESGAVVHEETLEHIACAVEMVHTYSLVHDDLPAMDDDDLRRGRPSCHKAFDEATAILAGDALQSRAFEVLADAPYLSAEQKVAMIKALSAAIGPRGMVGGQALDIEATDTPVELHQLQTMHALKTGALIRAALAMGGIASGASRDQLAALDDYGHDIGLAFQVVDDILDVESDAVTLGKTAGKDSAAMKSTYVGLMGLDGAKAEAKRLLTTALAALEVFGESANYLRDLAKYILERDH